MIIPTFIDMPVSGIPSAGMLQKAVDGGVGSESGIAFNSMSGLNGLGYDPGYDIEPTPAYGGGPEYNYGGSGDGSGYDPGYDPDPDPDPLVYNTGNNTYSPSDQFNLSNPSAYTPPPPTADNTKVAGSPGQSTSAWQQAMAAALIKTGGQIMNNVTMPAGMLAVRNANGSTTYYRQPAGSNQNLNVGGAGMYGGTGGVGVNMPGVVGGISTTMVMALTAAAGFAFIYMQQRGR